MGVRPVGLAPIVSGSEPFDEGDAGGVEVSMVTSRSLWGTSHPSPKKRIVTNQKNQKAFHRDILSVCDTLFISSECHKPVMHLVTIW